MRRISSYVVLALYVFTIIYFLFGYSTLSLGNDWAARLYPEDHFFENVGAVSLFAASAACFLAAALARRLYAGRSRWVLWVCLGLALIFFVGAGQEISWGQRIFFGSASSISAQPAALAQPAQANAGSARFDTIFAYLVVVAAVTLPVAYLALPSFRRYTGKFIASPYWVAGSLFPINYLFASFARESMKPFYRYKLFRFPQAVQAVKESNYELAALLLSLIILWQVWEACQEARAQATFLSPRPE